jgi:hypothetical protein
MRARKHQDRVILVAQLCGVVEVRPGRNCETATPWDIIGTAKSIELTAAFSIVKVPEVPVGKHPVGDA